MSPDSRWDQSRAAPPKWLRYWLRVGKIPKCQRQMNSSHGWFIMGIYILYMACRRTLFVHSCMSLVERKRKRHNKKDSQCTVLWTFINTSASAYVFQKSKFQSRGNTDHGRVASDRIGPFHAIYFTRDKIDNKSKPKLPKRTNKR